MQNYDGMYEMNREEQNGNPEYEHHEYNKCHVRDFHRGVFEIPFVLDNALDTRQLENRVLIPHNFLPNNLTPPYTFDRLVAATPIPTLSNIKVCDHYSDEYKIRVQMNVSVPVKVYLTDCNGIHGTADSVISIEEDLYMEKPGTSLFPYGFAGEIGVSGATGRFHPNGTLTVTLCCVVLIKEEVQELVELCFGFVEPKSADVANDCSSFLELPLYPKMKPHCED